MRMVVLRLPSRGGRPETRDGKCGADLFGVTICAPIPPVNRPGHAESAAGTCFSRCGMKLAAGLPEPAEYRMDLAVTPHLLRALQRVKLSFTVRDPWKGLRVSARVLPARKGRSYETVRRVESSRRLLARGDLRRNGSRARGHLISFGLKKPIYKYWDEWRKRTGAFKVFEQKVMGILPKIG
jgi:hypothetical protein